MNPANKTELLAAGFQPYAGSKQNFTHVKFPGMMFRVVATIEDAVAVGGVFCISPDWFQGYMGLDAAMTVGAGNLGKIAMPATAQVELLTSGFPVTWLHSSHGGASLDKVRVFSNDVFATSWEAVELCTSASVFVGIVTGLDRGYVHLRRTPYPGANGRWSKDFGLTNDPTTTKCAHDPKFASKHVANLNAVGVVYAGATMIALPDVAGYCYKRWALPKAAYFRHAFAQLLDSLKGEDEQVISKYSDACAAELEQMGPNELLEDGLRMHASVDANGSIVWVPGDRRPAVAKAMVPSTCCQERVQTESATLPLSSAAPMRTYSNMKDGIVPALRLVKIQPWIHAGNVAADTNATADSVQAYLPTVDVHSSTSSILASAVKLPVPDPAGINMRFVPHKSVKLSAGQTVDVSAVFACFSPIAGPTRANTPQGVCNLVARNTTRVPAINEASFNGAAPSGLATNPTTDAQYEKDLMKIAALVAGEAATRQFEVRIESFLPKEVAIVSARLDARVKNEALPAFNHTHPLE